MAEVFVSYARDDLEHVRPLVDALRADGLTAWWDQDVPPNAEWAPTIEAELDQAGCVIVCWSPNATARENVRGEARFAHAHGKLLQAFVKECTPPAFFGERQGADLTQWNGSINEERFRYLLTGVRAVLAGEKVPSGLGYKPRDKRIGAYIFAGVAILAAAIVGALWIPEVRERIFPPPPVAWQVNALRTADLRPALPPESPAIDRINSAMLIGMNAEFSNAGGHAATGVVTEQRVRMSFPGTQSEPVEFVWLWFAYTSDAGPYFQSQTNASPFRLDDETSAQEVFFQPTNGYTWSHFLHDLNGAIASGQSTLLLEFEADVESDGNAYQLTSQCRLPLQPILDNVRRRQLNLRSVVSPCRQAEPSSPAG